ncbi:type II secretion system F family protein [Persephonella atlantica]|uniref:Type II secretion system F family protein n=1 Tax=Persephonella atlantica TaxID=2699429 RepID=A0ABS1GHD4_9AQUI|nr:type II secretion system F family protein [Persephonella atlantica]MBK3332300.1 type II secretion system F family protein [Persephonella atlantica]
MPVYRYTAINSKGKEEKGIVETTSLSHLRQILKSKNLTPIFVEEIQVSSQKGFIGSLLKNFLKKKISSEELSLLLYQLGVLLERNVHITDALTIVSSSQENSYIKDSLLKIKSLIGEGKSISEAFSSSGFFPEFLTEMVKAGEESGALGKIFLSSSEFVESQNEFRSKIINSLIYPSIVIGVGFISLFIIMQVVIPTITKIYAQFKIEIPTSTKIVIGISQITSVMIKIIPIIIVVAFFLKRKFITPEQIDGIKMKIPFFNKVYLYSEISNFSSTMYLLLKGGVTLTDALVIAVKSLKSKQLQELFKKGKEEVEKGFRLSDSLKNSKKLPVEVSQMIALGEESGQMEEMFCLLSILYKKHTEKLINRFLTLLEPITLIVLSVMIGFFIFATLFPIFNLSIK